MILSQEEIDVLLSGSKKAEELMSGILDKRRQRFIALMQRLGYENRANTVSRILDLEDMVEELALEIRELEKKINASGEKAVDVE